MPRSELPGSDPAHTVPGVGDGMLVVGTRGRGGITGMLLGSVSEQCVRHAASTRAGAGA